MTRRTLWLQTKADFLLTLWWLLALLKLDVSWLRVRAGQIRGGLKRRGKRRVERPEQVGEVG